MIAAPQFAELVEAYVRASSKKCTGQYEKQLRKWALKPLGNLPAGAVKRADVKKLFDKRKNESASAAKLLLASISAAFRWALHEDWSGVTINPTHDISDATQDETLRARARERTLSDAELLAFPQAWEPAGLLRRNALWVILLTGQRPGEVRHMRWQDIEEGEHTFEREVDGRTVKSIHQGAWWLLRGLPDAAGWPGTKNAQDHRVWLTPAVLARLYEVCGDRRDGFVFATARGNPVDDLDKAMRDASTALGVREPARPHDLRRTHGTMTTRLGFSRDQMNRVQNHKEGGIASVYDRFEYRDEARAIQERVGAMIAHLVSGQPDPRVVDLDQRRVQRV